MPYFKNNQINLLFIHIPKTGGSSLEVYFSRIFNTTLSTDTLYTTSHPRIEGVSYQHQTYESIVRNNNIFNIDFNRLSILTIVRNPYTRILSELLEKKKINSDSSTNEVHSAIKDYLSFKADSKNTFDNHRLPQYLFITESGNLISNINILRTENLTNDMKKIGYDDFNLNIRKNSFNEGNNYFKLLNNYSIQLINEYYKQDFILFNYEMI
jgi:hypothetical protein